MLEIRENLDKLPVDIEFLEWHLPMLNCLDAATNEWPESTDLIVQQRRLQAVANCMLIKLNCGYKGVEDKIRWNKVAAHAINGGRPYFLSDDGSCQPMQAQGFFDSFELLKTPDHQHKLYIKTVLGIQAFWSSPHALPHDSR